MSVVFDIFRWDTGEFERMSPWDLQPVTECGSYHNQHFLCSSVFKSSSLSSYDPTSFPGFLFSTTMEVEKRDHGNKVACDPPPPPPRPVPI